MSETVETTVVDSTVGLSPELKQQWDNDRQRADQEKANRERIAAERDDLASERDSIKSQLDEARSELNKFQQRVSADNKTADDASIVELASYDPKVAAHIKKLSDKIDRLGSVAVGMQEKITAYEQQEQRKNFESQKNTVKENILSMCDDDFGAQFRNDAIKMADKLVDDGEEEQPTNIFDGLKLMKKCYRKIKESEDLKSKKVKTAQTDSGGGGVAATGHPKKTGSRSEILADLKKDKSWKT